MKKANSLQEEDIVLLGFVFSPPLGNELTMNILT